MKLKYNHKGKTNEIPLITDKPSGKRLAVRKNGQTYYAPLVPTAGSAASDIHLFFGGEVFAVQAQEPPEISAVNVAPSSVAVMQGQSAAATVTALTNDAVTGLSYGLSGAPTWITISDDLILIQPSDNDLGIANVQVIAQDTSSDAMSSAILRAEAKLRPIIESLSVIPPAVTVQQGQSAVATVSAVANEAVTGLSYSIDGSPAWVTLADDSIVVAPTDNDTGNAVMTVFAYDTNSSASAATQFVATATLRPIISSVSVNPSSVGIYQGQSTTATISAVANDAVTSVTYDLAGNPSWITNTGNVIHIAPTANDLGSATVTVTAQDTGSDAHAETVFNAEIQLRPEITNLYITPTNISIRGGATGKVTVTAETTNTTSPVEFEVLGSSSVSINSVTGIATIKPVAGVQPEGTYSYTIKASAGEATKSKQFSYYAQKSTNFVMDQDGSNNGMPTLQSGTGYDTITATFTSKYLRGNTSAVIIANAIASIPKSATFAGALSDDTLTVTMKYNKASITSSQLGSTATAIYLTGNPYYETVIANFYMSKFYGKNATKLSKDIVLF